MSPQFFMQRCLDLAVKAAGRVAPNPMVGAVLVHEGRIIGEGFHEQYGQAHAEVNCIHSVKAEDKELIPFSVLYVSLEPCAHFGKTPPCADLIIRHRIPTVIIGCRDPFPAVDGKGIEKLLAAGIRVETGILEKECQELNKRFFTFHTLKRPYVVLKWAQTADLRIGTGGGGERLLISNPLSNRLVHKWRSEEAAILVGSNTALLDNPELTTRLWPGHNPIRLVLDRDLKLPQTLNLFDGQWPTIVFNTKKENSALHNVRFYLLPGDKKSLPQQLLEALYQLNIQSVLVEGGATLLQLFINEGCWDEARVITNTQLTVGAGTAAPQIHNAVKSGEVQLQSDRITTYAPPVLHNT